ncbi:uncharacterized protein LOC143199692 [Rhynchophorus ferrugineus]|uniref:Tetraspanin n=1 Tax=Rhynchophorus ferrugineus TaxID=354439 RepID=A0A834I7J8_RHYFE|nr:hypothetical protein GWI33_013171 [Rhynchophorus ferrugineus]
MSEILPSPLHCYEIFDEKLLIYYTSGFLCIFGVITTGVALHAQKMPGPQVSIAQASIILGIVTCMFSLLGTVSIRTRQVWLTIINSIILACIFGVNVVYGLIGLTTTAEISIKAFLGNIFSMKDKNTFNTDVKIVQDYYRCCGYDGPFGEDVVIYKETYISKGKDPVGIMNASHLIDECCKEIQTVCTILDSYPTSCLEAILRTHKDWSKILGIILLLTAFNIIIVLFMYVQQIKATFF